MREINQFFEMHIINVWKHTIFVCIWRIPMYEVGLSVFDTLLKAFLTEINIYDCLLMSIEYFLLTLGKNVYQPVIGSFRRCNPRCNCWWTRLGRTIHPAWLTERGQLALWEDLLSGMPREWRRNRRVQTRPPTRPSVFFGHAGHSKHP